MTLQYIADNRSTLVVELRQRQAIVRDYVRGVAKHYATGLYLFGRPGTAGGALMPFPDGSRLWR